MSTSSSNGSARFSASSGRSAAPPRNLLGVPSVPPKDLHREPPERASPTSGNQCPPPAQPTCTRSAEQCVRRSCAVATEPATTAEVPLGAVRATLPLESWPAKRPVAHHAKPTPDAPNERCCPPTGSSPPGAWHGEVALPVPSHMLGCILGVEVDDVGRANGPKSGGCGSPENLAGFAPGLRGPGGSSTRALPAGRKCLGRCRRRREDAAGPWP